MVKFLKKKKLQSGNEVFFFEKKRNIKYVRKRKLDELFITIFFNQ